METKIVNLFDVKIKLRKPELIKEKIMEYTLSTETPTFRGLLIYLNITDLDWKRLIDMVQTGDKKAEMTYRYINTYKNLLIEKMESYMIYQEAHPDLKDRKFVNYKNYEYMLNRMNVVTYETSQERKELNSLENESGNKISFNGQST